LLPRWISHKGATLGHKPIPSHGQWVRPMGGEPFLECGVGLDLPQASWWVRPTSMEPLPEESGVGISYHLVLGPLFWEWPHPKALLCGWTFPKWVGLEVQTQLSPSTRPLILGMLQFWCVISSCLLFLLPNPQTKMGNRCTQ
jgi:hypothetical protein